MGFLRQEIGGNHTIVLLLVNHMSEENTGLRWFFDQGTGDMSKFSETQKLQNMLKQCHILS